jgi:secreted PhoX family phosphatase
MTIRGAADASAGDRAMSDDMKSNLSRREFIKTTAATASVVVGTPLLGAAADPLVQGAPTVNPRVIGANDRIQFGIIGVKGMGGGHLRNHDDGARRL